MKVLISLIGFITSCLGAKVYDWRRDWGSDVVTLEMAQVHDGERHIFHSCLDSSVDLNIAAISMHDFNRASNKFKKGIIAIRPILSDGVQACFVAKTTESWSNSLSTLRSRHKATVAKDATVMYELSRNLPSKLDPLTVPSVAEFCDTDRKHIFYMKETNDLSSIPTKVKIQGLFSRYFVGIPDKYVDAVIGITARKESAVNQSHMLTFYPIA